VGDPLLAGWKLALFGDMQMADAIIEPIQRGSFGLASHRFQQFDSMVRAGTTKEQLTDPALWVNVATKMNPGDEVRVRAEDDSFVALLHVTYTVGNQVRLHLLSYHDMEAVDYDTMHKSVSKFELKMRGQQKWCIMDKESGDVIKSLIPTQLEAQQELADLERALAA
jgi:hypothetical protein